MSVPFTESHCYPSYSQAGEDRILYYVFERLGRVHGLRYVDVGASSPAGHNNTYLFHTLEGSGVLVEADAMYLDAYELVRPGDVVENVAVVPRRMRAHGTVTFFRMQDRGWSTVSSQHAEVGRRLGKGHGDEQAVTVPCLTINEVLAKHVPDGVFDILSLDVEGVDTEILAELDTSRFRPRALVVENAVNPLGETSLRPPPPGYLLFASTYVNAVYLHEETYRDFVP